MKRKQRRGRGTGVLKENQLPLPFDPLTDIHILTQPPLRTDVDENEPQQQRLPNYRVHKNDLYGKQEGDCNGCKRHFEIRNLTVDHIRPQSKGGTDHPNNLQLLCAACNSSKGKGTQEELDFTIERTGRAVIANQKLLLRREKLNLTGCSGSSVCERDKAPC